MSRRYASGVRGHWSRARSGAVDQSRSLAQRGKPETIGVLLPPFDACLLTINTQAQIVLVSGRDLAGPEQTAGAFLEVQHNLQVVVEAAAGHEGVEFGGKLAAIKSGNKAGEIVSVSSNVSQRTRGSALRRIGAPDGLLLPGRLQRRGQPVLRIFNLDD